MEQVILVDEQDVQTGVMEKMEAHKKALLHRAFSVFVFNDKQEILMQQRAAGKYHSGGLWTNTCCSHPRPGEPTVAAASRRLQEEMGFSTELREAFSFIYRAGFANGLTEYEYDHVMIGHYNGEVEPNDTEVGDHAWWSVAVIEETIRNNPEKLTVWFTVAFPRIKEWLGKSDNQA